MTPIGPDENPTIVTPVFLVPGAQSGQDYRMVQNIIPVNKRTAEKQYQLTDVRRYRELLGRAKFISLIDLKAGFHNIIFDHETSYNSTFVCHLGKFRWLRMPFGLTQAPAHFQFVVESVLLDPEKPKLPCVIYLDDIAIFGDTKEEVLTYTAEAMKRLAEAGFMINLKKSTLCGQEQRILGHHWYSGGYWTPEPKKLESLMKMSDEQLQKCNRASLYGLLNFYREYVPNYAEVTEPIR